ncbi:hypothetical protein ACFV0C_37145 [Streptomyces sp. NPDC059568]|uniref:hypothetical protein n=1 Tax=Streptomyces sp. NPDC059568 TaxID=3346868 RepID=UPI0036CE1D82
MTAPPPHAPTTVDLLVVLTRLETKLDTATTGIADHETRIRTQEQSAVTQDDIVPLRADVETLKRARWPLPSIAALAAVAAVVIALYR